ncbi:hypothetical protein FB451DRAFT_1197567 [Mycena latifolia]|nr:hypothetical protein FB451DRAFT_1197567 [Mycena latifolia]
MPSAVSPPPTLGMDSCKGLGLFDSDRASLEHFNVHLPDEPESDLDVICDLYSSIAPMQMTRVVAELFIQPFYTDKNSCKLSVASPNDEQELNTIYDLYRTTNFPELSYILPSIHSSTHSEFKSATDLFIEPFYIEKNSCELSAAPTNDELDLDTIYDLYFSLHFPELSCHHHLPFIRSASDPEPASITDTFTELIFSQKTFQGVDFEILASQSGRDTSPSAHANFDEDLSYVHNLGPESLVWRSKSHPPIEPKDDPPSYQDSMLTPEPSFMFARPRTRAKFFINLLPHLFSIVMCTASAVASITAYIDRIAKLCPRLPDSVLTATDEDKIYHDINRVNTSLDSNTPASIFTCRMDILFARDCRDTNTHFLHVRRGRHGMLLVVQCLRSIKWATDGIPFTPASLKVLEIAKEMETLWYTSSSRCSDTYSGIG